MLEGFVNELNAQDPDMLIALVWSKVRFARIAEAHG